MTTVNNRVMKLGIKIFDALHIPRFTVLMLGSKVKY